MKLVIKHEGQTKEYNNITDKEFINVIMHDEISLDDELIYCSSYNVKDLDDLFYKIDC